MNLNNEQLEEVKEFIEGYKIANPVKDHHEYLNDYLDILIDGLAECQKRLLDGESSD